ncbi:purine-binding chemotaxis protein CheW [Xanthomonas sacchari]|uniref:chemotaxis protein CheW n=1 Tax=Xanthomonas sacchari TaxID=56458 RepID=UPI0020C2D6CB|nr:chemotaxis protein CheW [Xanthomonas sacchari]MDQ1093733.1 purine-binding chemotaxis protein CheW [Xanthomonas sacchari]
MNAPASLSPSDAGELATDQFLTFLLGKEMFGVGILGIKEIIEYRTPTDVPMMPPALRGVINLRGAVVPVVDLQQRFGRAPSEISKRTCIVIIEVANGDERQVLGLLVDAVSEVLEIAGSDIAPPPAFGAGIRRDFIHGMGKVGERFVILLDADAVLSTQEFVAMAGIETGAEETMAA